MSILFERFFHRSQTEEPDPAEGYYDDVDPEIARDYDAELVEMGLMTETEFNAEYPDKPFIPEAQWDPANANKLWAEAIKHTAEQANGSNGRPSSG